MYIKRRHQSTCTTVLVFAAACIVAPNAPQCFWSLVMHVQVPNVEVFMQEYHMQCPMAYNRLLQVGLPATIEHRKRYVSSCMIVAAGAALSIKHTRQALAGC